MRCYCKILCIYKDHATNKEVCAKIQQAIRPQEDLLTTVKRHKLQWYGHVSHSSGLAKTILQDTVKGGRSQGWQKRRWEDTRKWTGLEFPEGTGERIKKEETGSKVICGAPTTPAVKGLVKVKVAVIPLSAACFNYMVRLFISLFTFPFY